MYKAGYIVFYLGTKKLTVLKLKFVSFETAVIETLHK